MSALLNPTVASCPSCPWELACSSPAEKQRREQVHLEHAHGGLITQAGVTELVYDDPSHTADREEVERTIRQIAADRNGVVDPNEVRKALALWVNPRVTASVYSVWRRYGLLVVIGEVPNTDTKGRNTNKKLPLYRLRSAS